MRKPLATISVLLALVLGACGSGSGAETTTADTTTPETTAVAEDTSPTTTAEDENSGGPITISAENGEVQLDEPADRVVALEWAHAEMLLTLEVQNLAMADKEQYPVWIGAEPQPGEDVLDVGVRDEPSLEAIASFEPDLIVATETHEPIMNQLNEIAPTVRLKERPRDPSDGSYWEVVVEDFTTLATATGREAKAEEVLAEVDARLAELAAEVKEADLGGTTVAFASAWVIEGAPGMRIFTDNSFIWDSLDQLGLENAWDGEYVDWGFEGIEFEQLAELPEDTHFVYTAPDQDGANPYTDVLPGNAFWDQLPFVTENRVYETEDEIWTFGGPRSFIQAAEGVVAALTGTTG